MKLFIALPVYGGCDPFFMRSLLELVQRPPCDIMVRLHVGDSLVSRARNILCAEFLASGATHLLFLDTDLIFSPKDIARLVNHAKEGRQIVGGLYPKKQKELAWVCNLLDEPKEPLANGLQQVKYAGTGCLLISRQVFETMFTRIPELAYDPDEGDRPGVKWDFFGVGVREFPDGTRRYLSEDWMFCQRAADLGWPIWMDTKVVLKHVGQMVYPLQSVEEFAEIDTPSSVA